MGQGGANCGDFGLQPVAALQVAAILADHLGRGITGDRGEGRVHLHDRLFARAHIGDDHSIADMLERHQESGLGGCRVARPACQAVPAHWFEPGAIRRGNDTVVPVRRHRAAVSAVPPNPRRQLFACPLRMSPDKVA